MLGKVVVVDLFVQARGGASHRALYHGDVSMSKEQIEGNESAFESLGKGLSLPLRDLVYPQAAEIIDRHVRTLEIFANPPFLIANAPQAVQLTRVSHELCESLKRCAVSLGCRPHTDAELYLMAKEKLDERDQYLRKTGVAEVLLQPGIKAREIVLELILTELVQDNGEKSLSDLLDQRYPSSSDDFQTHAAKLQAVLLSAEKTRLSVQVQTLRNVAVLGVIWRGLFYFAVVEQQGGSLGRQKKRNSGNC